MGRFAMLVGGCALAGCGRPDGYCAYGNESAEATVEIVDGVPVFDWDLGTAYAVYVHEVSERDRTGPEVWHVFCQDDQLGRDEPVEGVVCLDTPIAYGEEIESDDPVEVSPAEALEPGVTYRVWLITLIDSLTPEPDSALLAALNGPQEACGQGMAADEDFVAP